MIILSIVPETRKIITGRLSDGSDRQEIMETTYFVTVQEGQETYIQYLNSDDQQAITDAFLQGSFVKVELTEEQKRIQQLESESADLWYASMLKDARISEQSQEIADLWFAIMTMGGDQNENVV